MFLVDVTGFVRLGSMAGKLCNWDAITIIITKVYILNNVTY